MKKRKKWNRLAGILLACTMVSSMAGCGGNSDTASAPEAGSGDSDGTKLTIAIMQNPNVENYDTNYLTRKLEEEMNIEVEFNIFPAAVDDAKNKLSVMANGGGELPDIVMMALDPVEVTQYGRAGIFIDLKDYLDDSSLTPNFNAIRENYPEDTEAILKAITSPDGGIYSLFDWRPEDWNLTPYRCWINKTWLDNLGMQIPTTTAEFAEVMEAFATKDPNQNGLPDEIALTGSNNIWGGYTPNFLLNSFVFYNLDNNGLVLDESGEKVVAPFVTDEWFEALKYMKELCDVGALDPAMFTMDGTACQALLDRDPNVVGCVCAGGWGYWNGGLDSPNFQDFTLLAPLEGPDGLAYSMHASFTPNRTFFITKSCKNPELAIAVGDWFYRLDNSLTVRYGEEGVDWSIDEADTSTRRALYASEGYECNLAILDNIWGSLQNKMWQGAGPQYVNIEYYRGKDSLAQGDDTRDGDIRTQGYALYSNHPQLLPVLSYTEEEINAISGIQTNIQSYVDSQLSEFVTGNRSLDDWDKYVKEIENMGLEEWISTAQTAYDRMK